MTAQPIAAQTLLLNQVEIVDTFAEAFPIKAARLMITAATDRWAQIAATELCGNATSVIACDVEAAIERTVAPSDTPDGRPGVAVLVFGFSLDGLAKALQSRVGQCVLTCPTTACYNGIDDCPKEKRIRIGGAIRYFGDGFQQSKKFDQRRFWRIPVMDGEFLCEDWFGTVTGVAGGNLLICGVDATSTLLATESAVAAIRTGTGIALPFPGGIVRSGSKVGSKYAKLRASTNDAYCPTLRTLTTTELPDDCQAVYEIVIDGIDFQSVQSAMRRGLHAAAMMPNVLRITAGNYGGKLGKHHFHLRDLIEPHS
ncbi:formylmethanofuran--tetrahydromethanopterin N-formyltransferase [Schlesneria paludicola]|uniref:formylmethanofuran--tetrahydromethanopterin N-formyltransferase n=1 Tax=Schlesneria paludicola TaxID=360056 RepID=UPI00029B0686|nr:formylmethanofuran--tetrahydromethanopterin N-formyltransferase [Schlesneria paludicola]